MMKKRVTLSCEIVNQHGARVVFGNALVIAPVERVSRPRAHLPTVTMFDLGARQQKLLDSVRSLAQYVVRWFIRVTLILWLVHWMRRNKD
jgi:hypothetical protein